MGAEQTQSKPKYGIMVQMTSLVIALLMYTTTMTLPALSDIAAAFPDVPYATIKLVSSIPTLMLCIFSLVSGWLTTKISIKKSVLLASALILVGILPAFFGNIYFVLATRVVFGIGIGLIFPLASAVIVDLYEGAKKDTMMGWKSAVGALAGVVFQSLGGYLTVYSWRYSFLGFLLVIPVMILVVLFLPDTGVQEAKPSNAGETKEKEGSFTKTLIICVIAGFILNVCQFSFMSDMSFIVTGEGLGTAADAGNVLSTYTAFSFVAGLVYVFFAKAMKKFTPIVAIFLVGVAFLVGYFGASLPLLYVSSAIFGIGFGFTNPALTLLASGSVTHPSKSAMAISIYVCSTGAGSFLSVYVLGFLTNLFGLTSLRADWQVSYVVILAGCIISFILVAFLGKKKETTEINQ